MREVWKDVVVQKKGITYDFTGYYQASSEGRIKSLERKVKDKGKYRTVKERILKTPKQGNGYLHVDLSKEGKTTRFLLHRLIGMVFIPNPENKPEINHDDGNKQNCRASNLYWATRSENEKHAYEKGLEKRKFGKENHRARKVIQYDLEGNFIRVWDSIMDIERELKIFNTGVCACCRGKVKTAGGYKWAYVERIDDL